MTVRIRLFAILRERAGRDSIDLRLDEGATVADALQVLAEHGPLADLLGRLPVQMAVNRDYATLATPLRADDELALIPPSAAVAGERTGACPRERGSALARGALADGEPAGRGGDRHILWRHP